MADVELALKNFFTTGVISMAYVVEDWLKMLRL
jgi:hypothetical protein